MRTQVRDRLVKIIPRLDIETVVKIVSTKKPHDLKKFVYVFKTNNVVKECEERVIVLNTVDFDKGFAIGTHKSTIKKTINEIFRNIDYRNMPVNRNVPRDFVDIVSALVLNLQEKAVPEWKKDAKSVHRINVGYTMFVFWEPKTHSYSRKSRFMRGTSSSKKTAACGCDGKRKNSYSKTRSKKTGSKWDDINDEMDILYPNKKNSYSKNTSVSNNEDMDTLFSNGKKYTGPSPNVYDQAELEEINEELTILYGDEFGTSSFGKKKKYNVANPENMSYAGFINSRSGKNTSALPMFQIYESEFFTPFYLLSAALMGLDEVGAVTNEFGPFKVDVIRCFENHENARKILELASVNKTIQTLYLPSKLLIRKKEMGANDKEIHGLMRQLLQVLVKTKDDLSGLCKTDVENIKMFLPELRIDKGKKVQQKNPELKSPQIPESVYDQQPPPESYKLYPEAPGKQLQNVDEKEASAPNET